MGQEKKLYKSVWPFLKIILLSLFNKQTMTHQSYAHLNQYPVNVEHEPDYEGIHRLFYQQNNINCHSNITLNNMTINPILPTEYNYQPQITYPALLNPIIPDGNHGQKHQRLPSLSHLLLSSEAIECSNTNRPPSSLYRSASCSQIENTHCHPYKYIDTSAHASANKSIPTLSSSTSCSSIHSASSSSFTAASNVSRGKKLISTLSRAATLTSRRRGRPRKMDNNTNNYEVHVFENKQSPLSLPRSNSSKSIASNTSSNTINKPRWQEAERLGLLEAIVKEKNLDDMASIRWDRISLAVGRAKKACKDQWRREILPHLMKGLNTSSKKKKSVFSDNES
ncbi:hypothetical protein BDB01DRAFT_788819 [Pilobolus umbonatus]|nr:hypothetical protein BDB01DRAFT_788819 [Pilobolus umbonatus]